MRSFVFTFKTQGDDVKGNRKAFDVWCLPVPIWERFKKKQAIVASSAAASRSKSDHPRGNREKVRSEYKAFIVEVSGEAG